MAPNTELKGILVALVTPFTADGTAVDLQALDAHVNRQIEAGVHGLVPTGSTGEFTTLSDAERRQVIEQTVKSAKGRVPVVAGIGDLSTARTVEHARHAAGAGAAALMVVPPFYEPLNLEQLHEFLGEIHKASGGLPIVYYNIPAASGLSLTPTEIAGLSDVGVTHLKDTSGNAPALTELLFDPAVSSRVTAFNGWDTLTFYGIAAGAGGSVWGATNIIPELSVELWKALAEHGDLKRGREIWSRAWPICKFLESHNYASAVKTGMELRGWKTGGTRKPFALLEAKHSDELAKLLKNAGVKLT